MACRSTRWRSRGGRCCSMRSASSMSGSTGATITTCCTPAAWWPVVVYGVSLVMPSIAYLVLVRLLIAANPDSLLARAVGWDVKGLVSTAIYVAGIALTFWQPWVGIACYVLVALIWLVPDRRIEGRVEG